MGRRGERSVEGRHRVAEDEQLRVDDPHDRSDDVVADGGVLRLQIEQRNGHVTLEWSGCSGARHAAVRRQSRVRSGMGTSRPVFADS